MAQVIRFPDRSRPNAADALPPTPNTPPVRWAPMVRFEPPGEIDLTEGIQAALGRYLNAKTPATRQLGRQILEGWLDVWEATR